MTTLTFEVPDKAKEKALLQVAKALGISLARTPKAKKEKPYNPEFVAKIQEGRQQIREGKTFTVNLDDLWK